MVACDRHATENGFRWTGRCSFSFIQVIAFDPVVDFSVEPMLVQRDARTAVAAFRESLAEADIYIRLASTFGVLQRNEKSTGVWLIVAVVNTAPGVDEDRPIGGHGELPGVSDLVGEYRRAEALWERDAG